MSGPSTQEPASAGALQDINILAEMVGLVGRARAEAEEGITEKRPSVVKEAVRTKLAFCIDIASVGEPSGDRLELSDIGLLRVSVVAADSGTIWSDANAVVATALAVPTAPAKGSLALENRDEEDIRDAREPDLRGKGALPLRGVETVCDGDGGGGGCDAGTAVDGGETGVCGLDGTALPSTEFSGGACASNRDREDGPATGAELPRARDAKLVGVGDRDGKGSSTSASGSGGPGVGSGVDSVIEGGSDEFVDKGLFFAFVRRFDEEEGCVQSSTSSM